uniref:helix-turn-helix domain-containing protein n=1 Tax=Halomonas piscis TaxID=3031727 RepID=UPI0028A281AA|nr:helix-turn-helix domain-containing protein [Halomonas piscis]
MGYQQLTLTQRYQIHAQWGVGMGQRQIARELGIHNSTISRELRRNNTAGGYDPEQAQAFSDDRRRTAWKWTKRLPSMITAAVDRLREEWSPEQVSGFSASGWGRRQSSVDLFPGLG